MSSGKVRTLAVIPARGGSKTLPGKNVRLFAGLPLVAHSVLFAKLCPEIDRCVVSTDSDEISDAAKRFGADVPFLRPAELAADDTPMWPVLKDVLRAVEHDEGCLYDEVILLDPTSPAREVQDVTDALTRLRTHRDADGVVSVSRPDFHPLWHCVTERSGWMEDFDSQGARAGRRQDLPAILRINGALYIWRAPFVRKNISSWRTAGRHLVYEIPELRAMSIDTEAEFCKAEALVKSGLISFAWLKEAAVSP